MEAGRTAPDRLAAGTILQLQATAIAQERFQAAAAAFATEVAAALGFDRVTLGFVEDGDVQVAAMSNTLDFAPHGDAARAAMDEALAQKGTIVYPPAAAARPHITLAHAGLVKRHGGTGATIPLVTSGRAFGAMTVQRFAEPISADEIACCEHLACFVAPILELKRRAEEPWRRRMRSWLRAGDDSPLAPRFAWWSAGALVALLAATPLVFVPVQYHVRAPARLEGSIQRAIVAPIDGYLSESHVRPGDQVVKGQVLAELSQHDLQLERRRRESELGQHESAAAAALSRSDRAAYAISQAKAAEARAQLELVDEQLARSRLQAPFDGVVIKGDLTRSLGAPVQRGEVLLTISPAHEFRLIVEVDERDVALIRPGQQGRLALAALPADAFGFRVDRVTPVSTPRDGRNFFEAIGVLDKPPAAALRPGLEGVAKIRAADRPLAWVWTHRLLDWLRINWWSWGV